MLCQICNKNPATIHIQEVVNGKKQSLHLCLPCAGKRSFDHAALDGMDLAELMNSLEQSISEMGLIPFKDLGKSAENDAEKFPDLQCPACHWTLAQFSKTGKLGCAACYDAFSEVLVNKLLEIHRSAIHTGKLPEIDLTGNYLTPAESFSVNIDDKRDVIAELAELNRDLKQSILREEYELAAQIRDRINALRNENGKGA